MGPREILIILVIVLLLFGAPKLPQLARSLGQSLRILKDETKNLSEEAPKPDTPASSSDEPRDGQK